MIEIVANQQSQKTKNKKLLVITLVIKPLMQIPTILLV